MKISIKEKQTINVLVSIADENGIIVLSNIEPINVFLGEGNDNTLNFIIKPL